MCLKTIFEHSIKKRGAMKIRLYGLLVMPIILFLLKSNSGLAQDFGELTKNIEIGFPESKGIVYFPPSSGTPLPQPKQMKMETGKITVAQKSRILCTIVISPDASVTERNAAVELSDQLAFMACAEKGPDIVENVKDISTPAVCLLGTSSKFFKAVGIDVPRQHEGFAIETGSWNGKDAVFIAGRDRFGVYWGVQTLKQMLIKEEEYTGPEWARQTFDRVLVPKGKIADWPDAQYRHAICMEYMMGNRIQTLAHLVRFGRANATTIHLMDAKGVFDRHKIKSKIDDLHKRGIMVFPYVYWVGIGRFFMSTENRGACPVADRQFIESLARTAFECGADGLIIQFDDIAPADLLHYKDCPVCSEKFNSIAESQVYMIESVLRFAEANKWGKKMFVVCPTLYSNSGVQYPPYAQIGLTAEKYLPEFCNFPGSEKVRFFHCDFTREDRERIRNFGHKNYVWWNNGPWSAGGTEVWGYSVALARMGYSWGLYDNSLSRTGKERFFHDKMSELRYLKGNTDFVFNGTNDLVGMGIGCVFAWDMERYMEREPEFQEWYVNNYYGKDVIGGFRAWEWTIKPLVSMSLKKQLFDESDSRLLEYAHTIHGCLQSLRPPNLPDVVIPSVERKRVLDILERYNSFSQIKEIKEIKNRILFAKNKDLLLSFEPKALVAEQRRTLPDILETWSNKDELILTGCTLDLPDNGLPALILNDSKGILTKKTNRNIDRFNFLVLPCTLSRGAKIRVNAVVDGVEYAGTPTMGHSPELQELLVPIRGKKLNSVSIYLELGALDRPEPCRVVLHPARLESVPDNTDVFLMSGEPLKVMARGGEPQGFLLSKNKILTANDGFTLSQRSFSVESMFTLTELASFTVVGTRATWVYLWTGAQFGGIPGWALGGSAGGFAFTLEDKDSVVSYVHGGGSPAAYTPYHVIGIRDFENRKLRLYVNGNKVSESEERGSGIFDDTQRTLYMSFDQWTAQYMNGLLNFVKIYDHALSEDEVKGCFRQDM